MTEKPRPFKSEFHQALDDALDANIRLTADLAEMTAERDKLNIACTFSEEIIEQLERHRNNAERHYEENLKLTQEVERLRKANFRMLDKLLRIRQVLDEDTDWTTPDSEASDGV